MNLHLVFEEWHRRWTEEPDRYVSEAELLAEPDDTYGVAAERYFRQIAAEIGVSLP